jgi:Domain of unknown function (DUF4034)
MFLGLYSIGRVYAVDELTVRNEITQTTRFAFLSGNTQQLEEMSREYRTQRSRTPSGLWKLTIFYSALSDTVMAQTQLGGAAAADALSATAARWVKANPTSPSAQVGKGVVMQERAWLIRGHGYANTVSPEAFNAFRKAMDEVGIYFELVKSTASSDPAWYCQMAMIALAQHWNRAQFDALATELFDRHPYYYQAAFCLAEYLAPKWYYEDAGAIERFADMAVQKTQKEDGQSLYARIYWSMADTKNGPDPLIVGNKFSIWPKMKAGFEDLIARYPDDWNLNHFAIYACMAGDKPKLVELLKKMGGQLLAGAWPAGTWEFCTKLAST